MNPSMFPERFTNLDAARARFGDRVDRVGHHLGRVDELADRVLDSFEGLPAGKGWALFQEALTRGIDQVPEATSALRDLFAAVDHVPAWVDFPTLDRGGELLFRAGLLGGLVLGTKSLVHGYLSPGGNKPLVFSGRLTEQAARRLNETSRFVQAVCRPGGLRRHADGFHITLKVRLMHAQVRRMILRSGKWDEAKWGKPINQHDASATSMLFSISVIDGLRTLGLHITPDEAESYVQLWRYDTWLLGAEPELIPASEFEAKQLAELIGMTEGAPDADSKALVHALVDSPLTSPRFRENPRSARRQRDLSAGLVRGFLGDDIADRLDLPASRWKHAIPAIRGVTQVTENLRQRVPAVHRRALEQGSRYWDRVVEIGLEGANAEFRPPDRISA